MVVMASFGMEPFCQLVQKYSITYTYLAPPVVIHLAKHPVVGKYDVSSLRMITSGGAPLTRDLIEAVYERLKIPTKQAYGLSETSPVTHMQVRLWSLFFSFFLFSPPEMKLRDIYVPVLGYLAHCHRLCRRSTSKSDHEIHFAGGT